jgi:hypothetical protein
MTQKLFDGNSTSSLNITNHNQNRSRNLLLIILVTISILITASLNFVVFSKVVSSNHDLTHSIASPAVFKNKFSIGKSNYSSQGSGEIIGDYLYTTGHNYTWNQMDYLLDYGADFLSINEECSRRVGNTTQYYREGLIRIPLNIMDTKKSRTLGIVYPSNLKNTIDPIVTDWNIKAIDPEIVYSRGIIKNRGEVILKGSELFNSNGFGLSGASYKFNYDHSVVESDDVQSYIVGFHIGSASATRTGSNSSGIMKINIAWISNGDGTFSYSRLMPDGEVIRADDMLRSECN